GKVTVTVTIEYPEGNVKAASINQHLLKTYYSQLKAAAEDLGDKADNLLALAVNLPEVIQYDEGTVSEEEWRQLLTAFNNAMAAFQAFRQDEGQILEKDLSLRINNILAFLKQVETLDPERLPAIRERLRKLLDEHGGKESVDQNRFEQELIFYIDKLDITEEKVRLKSHCDYFLKTLDSAEANGKKLAFISQEIGREINTMGSKANDAAIQQVVVGMKEELEKIKEQLLNVI